MDELGIMKKKYPHISQSMRDMMFDIGATTQQLEAADKNAKANIDSALVRYLTDVPKIRTVLVGEDGPGKHFIARTLLGENGCHCADGTDVKSVINGLEITMVNTTGSWQIKVPQGEADMTTFVIFVIGPNSQAPTLSETDQDELKKVVNQGLFVAVMVHPEGKHVDPKAQGYLRGWEDYPLPYKYLGSDKLVHLNISSEQHLGSTQQDIICKMLLNAAMNNQSSQQEANEAAAQGYMCPGDTHETINVIHSGSGGTTMNATEYDKNEIPVGEGAIVEKGDESNSKRNHLGKRTNASAFPGEGEGGQVPEKSKLLAKGWVVIDGDELNKLRADGSYSSRIGTVVIGATGSGKSATANTLLGENAGGRFREGSSAVSVTTKRDEKSAIMNGVCLTVVDTPGSWQANETPKGGQFMSIYVFVINLASPRFDSETLAMLENIQDSDGNYIIKSGQFVVALTHADSTLQNKTLEKYLEEIEGDPLHTFLTVYAKGKVIALNNATDTEYQRNAHRQHLLNRILLTSSTMGTPTFNKSRWRGLWSWATWFIGSTLSCFIADNPSPGDTLTSKL